MECILIKDIRPGLKNINVVFIVLDVGVATLTKENREVRTFKVADASACINVSVWDEPGKLLVPGDIVRLTKGYASIWRQCLTLYSGKNGDIHKIGDFCLIFNEQVNMSEPNPNFAQTNLSQQQQQQGLMNNGNNNLALNGSNNGGNLINAGGPMHGGRGPQQQQKQGAGFTNTNNNGGNGSGSGIKASSAKTNTRGTGDNKTTAKGNARGGRNSNIK